MTFAFVLLQYQMSELTKNCVDSVLALDRAEDVHIVVADNCSTNGAAQAIAEHYDGEPRVNVLFGESNTGFSSRNNDGFLYAKKTWDPDFIIIANNDTVFEQSDTLSAIESIYERERFFVLGPDILQYTLKEHQSPTRPRALTEPQTEEELASLDRRIKRNSIDHIKKAAAQALLTKKAYAELIKKRREANRPHMTWDELHFGAVMFGACHIFSRDFIALNDKAYYPETFLTYEEDILAKRCEINGWRTVYDPSVQVLHKECGTMDAVNKKARATSLFKLNNMRDACTLYAEFLKHADEYVL